MLCAKWSQHRFVISTNAILLKILPAKVTKTDRSSAMMETFGMTNNFVSRFSKKYKA
jgi:hypothetical protein